ncbi:hypothetical protein [Marivivens aquimaris]|uniref:hypothetical protein n=1 Tax=Marivivens aquimaris TaxID=2774876 RepID=UPI001880666B|nr:hypothetical protein [Marivivens aquimaris]
MSSKLEDLLAGVPAQNGNNGEVPSPTFPDLKASASRQTQLDKTTAIVKQVLDDEQVARAEERRRLKEARENRDKG